MSLCRCRTACTLILAVTGTTAAPAPPSSFAREPSAESRASTTDLDEFAFREGLRRRGLTEWLSQYDADHPAADPVAQQLRRRDDLLAEADRADLLPYERRGRVAEANAILRALVAEHTNHASRLKWQLELVRDELDRRDPGAFEAVLLYESGGRARASVALASVAALQALDGLRKDLRAAWDRVGESDEEALAQATAAGTLRDLEAIDRQAAVLSVWAEFYHALGAELDEQRRTAGFRKLVQEVTERQGWTTIAGPGQESLRCSALVIAAVSCRQLKRFDEGTAYARQILTTMTKVGDPAERQRLRQASLLGILEQIRDLRDAGRLAEALGAVGQARQWAEQTRPEDKTAFLAIALLESSILARQIDPRETTGGLAIAKALEPVGRLADQSPAHRELAYAVFDIGLALPPLPELTASQVQLAAGAALHHVVADLPAEQRRDDAALKEAVRLLLSVVAKPAEAVPPATIGELMFLLGRGFYLSGDLLEACGILCDLAKKYPKHDRALTAAEQAVAIAQELLRSSGEGAGPEVRGAFLRAGRLLRDLAPGSAETKRLQYHMARALEDGRQLREAAQEYALVAADDVNALKAAVRRARCLRMLLQQAAGEGKTSPDELRALAAESLKLAGEAVAFAQNHSGTSVGDVDFCLVADAVLLWAGLLNSPLIARSAEADEALRGFEERFRDCPGAVGQALRERVLALRRLKKLAEARDVVERFLKADPEHAGPVMARLLEAMRDEIGEAADRGDDRAVKELAEEAVRLADRLLEWFSARSDQAVEDDAILIRVWRAWSLVDAGQPQAALVAFRDLAALPKDRFPENAAARLDVRLGEATCLLAAGKPEEAVGRFNEIWQQTQEYSSKWWQAFAGNLQCLLKLDAAPASILQPIAQQRFQQPALGGPRWRRVIEAVEKEAKASAAAKHPGPQKHGGTGPADR